MAGILRQQEDVSVRFAPAALMNEHQPIGNLKKTRAYHRSIGSSSPIPPEVGDDVPWGDTLNPEELQGYYDGQLEGLRRVLMISPERRSFVMESGLGGVIETFRADLATLEEKGIDTSSAKELFDQL